MGRSYWLTDEPEPALDWLNRATTLNPNYAQGFYASALHLDADRDGHATEAGLDKALLLSPLDPLLYGFHGVRAQMLIQNERLRRCCTIWRQGRVHAGRALPDCDDCLDRQQSCRTSRPGVALEAGSAAAQRRCVGRPLFCSISTRDTASREMIAAVLAQHGF